MKFGSVCSGIGAPEVAWSSLGWSPQWFSEIAAFPSRVLAHHYPKVPNHGSLVGLADRDVSAVDVVVGGTPCQSFSIAGLRGGLTDERGNLALEFCRLVGALRPRWFVWENVPGVLSSNGGADFGSIIGAMVELGYDLAWRVLDARYFGVAQRRRRVFIVGCLGGAASAGAVLFEPEGMRRDTPATESKGIFWDGTNTCQTLDAVLHKGQMLPEKNRFPVVMVPPRGPVSCSPLSATMTEIAQSMQTRTLPTAPVLDLLRRTSLTTASAEACSTLDLRRLTPMECERLMGLPDAWTDIPGASDTRRYHAIGNSMAVPVLRWIGQRIELIENVLKAATDGPH